MKINVSDDISTEDIPAISLSLYHTAKSVAASGREPQNAVEFTLKERAHDAFATYLQSMRKSVLELMEKA
jgi:hypothetical protein